MHSIKISFIRLCFVAVALLAVLIGGDTQAQQAPLELRAGGDIVLQNILPDSPDITMRIERLVLEENSFNLLGAMFVGKPPDTEEAQAAAKIADIDIVLTSRLGSDSGDTNRHIRANIYNIRSAALRELDLLPIDLPEEPADASEADRLRLALAFEIDGDGNLSPLKFTALAKFLDMSGQFAIGSDFNLTKFTTDIRRLHINPFFVLLGGLLPSDDLEAEGYFSGHIDLNETAGGDQSFDINLRADDITLTSPTLFPEAQVIKSPTFEASYDFGEQSFSLKAFDFGLREMRLRASADATLDRDGNGRFALGLKMLEGYYFATDLATDWPLLLAPRPRLWVVENVIGGYADDVQLALEGQIMEGVTEITDFSADLQTKDGEFTYWGAMPKVSAEEIAIHFTQDDLTISTDNAMTADMRDISAAINISIPAAIADGSSAVATIDIRQDFDKLSALLNRPRLALLDKLGIPKEASAGDFVGQAELQFVLERSLTAEDIDFIFDGTLADFSSPETPFGAALPVEAESLSLRGDRQEIDISSEHIVIGELNGKFRWLIDLQAEDEDANRYSITTALDEEFWNMPLFRDNVDAIPFDEYIGGEAEIAFSFADNRRSLNSIRLDIDLTAAEIHIDEIYLHKPAGMAGRLSADVEMSGPLLLVSNFTYDDDNNSIALNADIDQSQEYALQKLEIEKLTTPTSDLSAVITYEEDEERPNFNIKVEADKLDLIRLFNYTIYGQSGPEDDTKARASDKDFGVDLEAIHDPTTPNFEVTITAKTLADLALGAEDDAGENPDENPDGNDENIANLVEDSVEDLNFYTNYRDGRITAMNATVKIGEAVGYVNYLADGESTELHGDVPNLGALLHYTGFSNSMRGGAMKIDMQAETAEDPMVGNFDVVDFKLRGASVLGRLLQLISAAEAAASLTGSGLHFNSWENQISYKDDLLTFNESVWHGTTVGLSMHGTFSAADSQMDLDGTVVPFYWISSNITKLPILSWIFSDDIDNATFGFNYTIDGQVNEPNVAVNPASILTPGWLIGIFSKSPDKTEATEN